MTRTLPAKDTKQWVWLEDIAALLLLGGLMTTLLVSGGTSTLGLLIFRIGVVGSALLATLGYALSGRWTRPAWVLLAPLSLYLLVADLSAFRVGSYTAWQELLNIICYALGFVLSLHLFGNKARVRWLWYFLAVLLLVMGVYGLLQVFGHDFSDRLSKGDPRKISSFYFNEAHYGGLMVLLTPIAMSMAVFARRWWLGLLWGALGLLLIVNLFFTSSWDAFPWMGLGLLLVFLAWAFQGPNYGRVAGVLLVLLAVVTGMLLMWLKAPLEVGKLVGQSPQKLTGYLEYRIQDRLLIFRTALKSAEESPWIGVGPGQFIYHATLYRPPIAGRFKKLHGFINYAHNDYLQVLSETGLLGLLGWLGFLLVGVFRRSYAPKPLSVGAAVGVICLLLHGLTDANFTVIPATVLLAWCLLGMRNANATTSESEAKVTA